MSILKSEAFKRTWRQERVSHSKSWRMRNTFQEVRIARKCKSPQAWANLAGLVPQLSGAGRIHLIYKQPTDLYWCIVIAVRAWVLGRGGKWYGCGEENGRICDNLAPVTQDGYPLVYTVSVWHRKVMLMSFTFYSVNIWEDQDMFFIRTGTESDSYHTELVFREWTAESKKGDWGLYSLLQPLQTAACTWHRLWLFHERTCVFS